jgi:hypothetical protein
MTTELQKEAAEIIRQAIAYVEAGFSPGELSGDETIISTQADDGPIATFNIADARDLLERLS